MAKVPYSKEEVLARFDTFGSLTWMDGITYTATRQTMDGQTVENKNETNDRLALEIALDAADPAMFEPAPQSIQTSAVLEAINSTSILDAVRDAHSQTLEAVRETARLSIEAAKTELEAVKRDLASAKAELDKLKKEKSAKTTAAVPVAAVVAGTGAPNPASTPTPPASSETVQNRSDDSQAQS